MKKASCIFILFYYTLGSLILPLSDFSILPELRDLYTHCKATEDKDLNAFDFITDHLINIDGIFDAHDHNDEQKPHKAFDHKINTAFTFVVLNSSCEFSILKLLNNNYTIISGNSYHFDFAVDIFRPPIV